MQTHIQFQELTDLFQRASQEGRDFLFEYEVYEFIRLIGGETPPQYYLLKKEARVDGVQLDALPGDKVVIKVVSPFILHKSDVNGVRVAMKTTQDVLSNVRRMMHEIPLNLAAQIAADPDHAPAPYKNMAPEDLPEAIKKDIVGCIICQYMKPDSEEFGNELLVSLRNSREFGMILSAGLGGRDTELYAERFRKGQAVVSASTEHVDGQTFFNLFKETISYKKLAGLTRGQQRIVTDDQLLECFEALIRVGRYFSPSTPRSPYTIEELEVNPFAFSNYLMMPLDGLCRFTPSRQLLPTRPVDKIDRLLHPATIGIVGISSKKVNIGRIILHNILAGGFDPKKLALVHPDAQTIDNIPTIASLADLQTKVDLLILAVNGSQIPEMIDDILRLDLAESVVLISGGLGERDDEIYIVEEIQQKILAARKRSDHAPVFLGANSLGIFSHPGRYDSMFIPESKLPKKRGLGRRSIALVSQSGAYMITRMSKLSFLNPAYAISIGNQIDLTAGDFMQYLKRLDELDTLAFYVEGFTDLDGLCFAEAIRHTIPRGKEVIFYKAGRTPEGKDALSGHTASIAGDYMVCESVIGQAGAMIADTFKEFEGLLRLSYALHHKTVSGNRLAAVSNAGYEAVGIADNILGEGYRLEMATLSGATRQQLQDILVGGGLDSLTGVTNPLDITPMASEEVYTDVISTLLDDANIDAVIVAIVPLTPMLHTLPEEFAPGDRYGEDNALLERISTLNDTSTKPLVLVVDSGNLYDPMANAFQEAGLPVFRSADIAVGVLGKYMQNRIRNRKSAPGTCASSCK